MVHAVDLQSVRHLVSDRVQAVEHLLSEQDDELVKQEEKLPEVQREVAPLDFACSHALYIVVLLDPRAPATAPGVR